MTAARELDGRPHVPVLLGAFLETAAPVRGVWLDGTFGAGGYARGLLDAGAERVIAIDRDPEALRAAESWAADFGDRLALVRDDFGRLDAWADVPLDGVVLDLGVSSMQLDRPERGFSFRGDGPLDMRMGDSGPTAADVVNSAGEGELTDILRFYGEERAAHRIARAIARARGEAPIETTSRLASIVENCLPRPRPGRPHPATRSFQALRMAVNGECSQLADGLEAAERALAPGGRFAVVAFHSIEDRMVKRYFRQASARGGQGGRHGPPAPAQAPRFCDAAGPIAPGAEELAANPRARSARLRHASRTNAPARPVDREAIGMPILPGKGRRR